MACGNFVCVFSYFDKGKIHCISDVYEHFNEAPDCTATSNDSCGRYKFFSCKICGHENICFKQREKGAFYSAEKGNFVPKSSTDFAKAVQQNELVNAKRDIYDTAISNYCQGYRTSTTVRHLYEKYGKKFPQFTKEFLDNAVHKSIIQYLKTET